MRAEGYVEALLFGNRLLGWARLPASVAPVALEVVRDGVVVASGETSIARQDLGSGLHGFALPTGGGASAAALLTGRLAVRMVVPDAAAVPLPLVPELRQQAARDMAQELAAGLAPDALMELTAALAALTAPLRASQTSPPSEGINRATLLGQLGALPAWAAVLRGAQPTEVSAPLGHVSADGTAVLGRRGYAFLLGGGNAPLEQALADPGSAELALKAEAWAALVAARARICEAAGQGFVQLLIPEKHSALPECLPAPLPTPTPLWRMLEARLEAGPAAGKFVSVLPALRALAAETSPYLLLDTHLSPAGAHAVLNQVLGHMGLEPPFRPSFIKPVVHMGDLATRLFGVPFPAPVLYPPDSFVASLPVPVLVEREGEPDQHRGSRLVWRTPGAPFDARVVCFGNSFFLGGESLAFLSWWFSRAFREFHFLWSPELEADYLEKHPADWVICQTVERFLVTVPDR